MSNDVDVNNKAIVFSPQQSADLTVKMVDTLRKDNGGGIKSGIPDMDRDLVPFRPGELITVLGYTSNYKSGFMNWLTKQAIKAIGHESNEVVVKVTWEQSIEEDTLSWLASTSELSITKLARGLLDEPEWVKLEMESVRRAATPFWLVGHSTMESKDTRRARPRMTMTDVARAFDYIANRSSDTQMSIKMIVLDYLQRIRPDRNDGNDRREQMMEAVNRAKDAAIAFGCPVVLGVQTNRKLMEREDKMPSVEDGAETGNIEQSSDKMFGVWYPIKSVPEGKIITLPGGSYTVDKNLLVVKLLKQKLGAAPLTFPIHVDPEKNILHSMVRPGR